MFGGVRAGLCGLLVVGLGGVLVISVVYGLPGAGKGYYLARRVRRAVRSGRRVYSTCAFDGARRLYSLVDVLAPEFQGALFVVDEAGSFFDARQTIKNPLPGLVFSALTLHRKGGCDIIMACQSIQYLDVQIRRVTQEWIEMRRWGRDATRRLVSGRSCWLPWFHRPLGFKARCYAPDDFSDKMELLGIPSPTWSDSFWWSRGLAESFDTSERVINPEDESALQSWLATAATRADVDPWKVRKGRAEVEPAPVALPAARKGLVLR